MPATSASAAMLGLLRTSQRTTIPARLCMARLMPIHYVLIVGYDDTKEVLSHGCSCNNAGGKKYTDLMGRRCKRPGRSRNNTIRIFELPDNLPGDAKVSEKGLKHKAERMLKPSVSMLGIPAMRKLAGEIVSWQDKECFDYMVAYAGMTPPHTIAYSINYHTLSPSGSLDTI